MNSSGWIGVDLDSTLAKYDGWRGHTHIGEPVPLMVARVQKWLSLGFAVQVFTARVSDPDPVSRGEVIAAIQKWTKLHVGVALPVTNMKDYAMLELWDDRAVQVQPDTGIAIGHSTRGL